MNIICVMIRVITKQFYYRFVKSIATHQVEGQRSALGNRRAKEWFFCPAQCGRVLATAHPSYKAYELGEAVKLPNGHPARKTGISYVLRMGRCDCGVVICGRCEFALKSKEYDLTRESLSQQNELHDCRLVDAEVTVIDEKTMALMAKIGKKCPGCGNFVQRTAGCDIMMCGTNAHGKVNDALRNGGCALIFNWQTLKPCDDGHGYTNAQGKWVKGKGPKTDRQVLLNVENTPIAQAIRSNNLQAVKQLLKGGLDITKVWTLSDLLLFNPVKKYICTYTLVVDRYCVTRIPIASTTLCGASCFLLTFTINYGMFIIYMLLIRWTRLVTICCIRLASQEPPLFSLISLL